MTEAICGQCGKRREDFTVSEGKVVCTVCAAKAAINESNRPLQPING